MPNWCSNDLYISGKAADVERFIETVKGAEPLDFNKLVPMPSDLADVPAGSDEVAYWAKYGSEKEIANILTYDWVVEAGVADREQLLSFLEESRPESSALADKYKANVDRYGHLTWYTWTVANWGTKWNAKCAKIERRASKPAKASVKFTFDTAWSPPLPVIHAAATLFPTLLFKLCYYECAMGFKGRLVIKGDNVREDDTSDYRGSRGG